MVLLLKVSYLFITPTQRWYRKEVQKFSKPPVNTINANNVPHRRRQKNQNNQQPQQSHNIVNEAAVRDPKSNPKFPQNHSDRFNNRQYREKTNERNVVNQGAVRDPKSNGKFWEMLGFIDRSYRLDS